MTRDEAYRDWQVRYQPQSASPGVIMAMMRMILDVDLRAILPTIRVLAAGSCSRFWRDEARATPSPDSGSSSPSIDGEGRGRADRNGAGAQRANRPG